MADRKPKPKPKPKADPRAVPLGSGLADIARRAFMGRRSSVDRAVERAQTGTKSRKKKR